MKSRVTISVSTHVLRDAERLAKARGGLAKKGRAPTRSGIFEEALRGLIERERNAQIDASLDAYYATTTPAEQLEERRMVRAFNRSQHRADLDDEGA